MSGPGLPQNLLLKANFSRPADNTAYSAGDAIANSATLASVVPLTFTLPSPNGILTGCRCVVAPASSNLVITALDFNLLIFAPATSIPFAAGSFPADNTAMAITAASFRDLIATFSFVNTAWLNPAGALTAGATGTQAVAPSIANAKFNLGSYPSTNTLIGVVQAVAAWTPLGVLNRFDFALNATLD
jgi:hypothetical protein